MSHLDLIRRLAGTEPLHCTTWDSSTCAVSICYFCGVGVPFENGVYEAAKIPHEADCPWVEAQALLKTNPCPKAEPPPPTEQFPGVDINAMVEQMQAERAANPPESPDSSPAPETPKPIKFREFL